MDPTKAWNSSLVALTFLISMCVHSLGTWQSGQDARTPVVGLYPTTNPLRARPYSSAELVVNRYPEAIRQEYGKSVDETRWGSRVRNPDAMNLITVADVTEKLDAAFAQQGIEPVH